MDTSEYEPRSTSSAIAAPPADLRLMSRDPTPQLARWVSRVWTMEGCGAPGTSTTLPDGCIDLIIGLGAPGEAYAYVAGLQRKATHFAYDASIRSIGVRLRPGAALGLLDTPVDALTDDRASLEALIGGGARDLEARLGEATSWRERGRALEGFLAARFARARIDPRVERAVAMLLHAGGAVTMRDLTRDTGTSPRTLDRLFYQWVGTSPKRFGLIVRFQSALDRAVAQPTRSWAALALEAGFSDQAHLVREFVRFTGVSPTRLLPHRHPRMADLFKSAGDDAATDEA